LFTHKISGVGVRTNQHGTDRIAACPGIRPALKDSLMFILRALAFLFLTQAILAQQPTPILPDPKLTPGDRFEVTAQDVCIPGYAKKVRAVPAWLKRQAYAEYGITQYKTGDYEVDHLQTASAGKIRGQAGLGGRVYRRD